MSKPYVPKLYACPRCIRGDVDPRTLTCKRCGWHDDRLLWEAIGWGAILILGSVLVYFMFR